MLKRLLRPGMIVPVVAGLIGGAFFGTFQLSCGTVQTCAADECPAGPAGPTGPAGPRGPGFGTCQWLYKDCAGAAAGTECAQICPADTHPVSGSCDAAAGATLVENRASVDNAIPFPSSPAPFTAYDRWVCETSTGTMQFTYALCCSP
jgi:hypothetical protein